MIRDKLPSPDKYGKWKENVNCDDYDDDFISPAQHHLGGIGKLVTELGYDASQLISILVECLVES